MDILLKDHNLYIDSEYQNIANLFCNTGTGSTKKGKFLLSTWYDGYIYTAILGIRLNQREKHINKTEKQRVWSSSRFRQYKYLIALLLSKKDILNELNLLEYKSIIEENEGLKITLEKIKDICDEYSNGGLKYLSEKYEKDNSIFDDYDSLINIMREVVEK
jgi:hypothetical protein